MHNFKACSNVTCLIMGKEKLIVTVEMASDGSFSCYIEDDSKDFGAVGMGKTSEEAIDSFRESYRLMSEEYRNEGKPLPEYDFEYKYDLRSFFDYFNCFNTKKIAEMSGINYAQLNQYLTGRRNAGRMQYEKIAGCIRKITQELQVATF